MSLLPHAERQARAADKRWQILRFLRSEIWSTQSVIGQVIGVSARPPQWRVLVALEKEGLVTRAPVEVFGKKVATIWGITAHGQAMAVDVNAEDEEVVSNYFEPGKFSPFTAQHHLDIQEMRLRAEAAGWTDWLPGTSMGLSAPGMKRPDAVARSPGGLRVALEVERTAKTRKRYVEIVSSALQAIKRGDFDCVHYVCPTEGLAAGLERLFRGIKQVRVKGQAVQLQEQHYKRFRFFEYGEWPSNG